MHLFDFFYENLPFSIFDDFLVKHHNIPLNEFAKYKQSFVKNAANSSSIQESSNLEKSGKKNEKKKIVKEQLIDKNAKNHITNFFKKI